MMMGLLASCGTIWGLVKEGEEIFGMSCLGCLVWFYCPGFLIGEVLWGGRFAVAIEKGFTQ